MAGENEERRPPILLVSVIVVLAVVVGIGAYGLTRELTDSSESQREEFAARAAAKSAYYEMDNTVGDAVCESLGKSGGDWAIECRMEREMQVEVTLWQVTPEGDVRLREKRFEKPPS